ncbi:hypothetical protein MnTg02_01128 [bacterium MnTg02]|nr:hypothetical protein MnTg02_01128 [bacterium MnTg02]
MVLEFDSWTFGKRKARLQLEFDSLTDVNAPGARARKLLKLMLDISRCAQFAFAHVKEEKNHGP